MLYRAGIHSIFIELGFNRLTWISAILQNFENKVDSFTSVLPSVKGDEVVYVESDKDIKEEKKRGEVSWSEVTTVWRKKSLSLINLSL